MGKDLKGRELGNMITQRKDGVYYAIKELLSKGSEGNE